MKHVILYRVERLECGCGPHTCFHYEFEAGRFEVNISENPSPWAPGEPFHKDWRGHLWNGQREDRECRNDCWWKFAFKSVEQMFEWFGADLWAWLSVGGFAIVSFKHPINKVRLGKHQVAFYTKGF